MSALQCGFDAACGGSGAGGSTFAATSADDLGNYCVERGGSAVGIFVVCAAGGERAIQRGRAESGAIASLGDLHTALSTFAAAQPDHAYPTSLESLGDRARADAQLAQSVGYQLTYTPGDPGADGVIRGYSLLARAGNYGYRNFYLDDGGTMRATKENRAANSHDPPM